MSTTGAVAAAAASAASGGGVGVNPLVLQSRQQFDQPPPLYPPRELPQPTPLTQTDKELVERSRFLSETMKYSGYYVVPSGAASRSLPSHISSSTAEAGQQQVYTPAFERYSDRYRKILGKKNFYDEISQPNPHLFPPELLSAKHRIRSTTIFASKAQFLSSKTLANEVARLVAAGSSMPINDAATQRQTAAGDRIAAGGEGVDEEDEDEERPRRRGEDEEEEEDQQQEMDEDSDDMDGGDYTGNYYDDDENDDDAFGDDGDEGEVF